MNLVAVTVIISFYNKISALNLIFEALKNQSYKNFEVIVSDDGSTTEIVAQVSKLIASSGLNAKHIWHEDLGWRKNIILNKSIVNSSGEYLIFIDGDCIPHSKFIEEHLANREQNVAIAGRRIELPEKFSASLTPDKIRSRYLERIGLYKLLFESIKDGNNWAHAIRITSKFLRNLLLKEKQRAIKGCNFSMYKKDILRVNGFDERYLKPSVGEDDDLELRMRNAGMKTKSLKHLITLYHLYHKKQTFPVENWAIYNDNKEKKISATPFGIIKH